MVANLLGAVWGFFQNLFSVVLSFISNLFVHLFNGLITVLKLLFKPFLVIVALIFYFIYKLGELIATLFVVLLAVGKLLFSFVMGLYNTLAGLVWTSTTPSHGAWSTNINSVFSALESYQLDKVAYVMAFIIWVTTALAVIKILSSKED